jgi:hypothetical protein
MKNRTTAPELALLVSCIGRKLVMSQRVEEEIEHVRGYWSTSPYCRILFINGPFNGETLVQSNDDTNLN